MYGLAEYLMMLQEGEKARLERHVQEVDQKEKPVQSPDEEWATMEEE